MEKNPEVGKVKPQFGSNKFKNQIVGKCGIAVELFMATKLNCLRMGTRTTCDWWYTSRAVAKPNGGECGPAYSDKGGSCTKRASIRCRLDSFQKSSVEEGKLLHGIAKEF
ncbi:uncharacterized protein LOC120780267 [Bactrocera tryoni]|uniref:uncharacterized protein LOC120780267 n=1 Tax=Bactrocera tryoni TaxID=59916 RepID=UPI001A967C15|nr:uncharacterized protein LOC120780267 [Bactrocera tryoni]XP_039968460.1 uncharacterized protein LOC120780267 [Bactrocera tryoni]XP_039968461.1 uncharacterized protein LOC120780267 [Bactrocera tryoni]XP_039968462.1 uncharacterized protein LOC120780267 [Bactrocera tryoni]XP_039968463.1 uncharacterized protein LOC120780267 [Bactrocera tryoni]XP_039968464.1 uncharacterized protein LOC120780267 [Bactrocera tryoni]